ncbi:hypothetical protein BN946_scf184884.g60 [Trametes cinnabarina]|uniref:ATP-dependent DNA helicase n=1 Tax=Pycnoporus cinnabarinus TaxID=5643 RepID=A0A060S6S4_PYCCI|nr:hypothetical protein BN946_scf184884.g60 [Trametes cinnabarina]
MPTMSTYTYNDDGLQRSLSNISHDITTGKNVWRLGAISSPSLKWGELRQGQHHQCPTCHIILLTGEKPGFCCGPKGRRYTDVAPLPPLPFEYEVFIHHPKLSFLSRTLNLVFSFASLETTAEFPRFEGDPGFVAIQGRIYHRIRPQHTNSAVRWLLYDGFLSSTAPHADLLPSLPAPWIDTVRSVLLRVNPFTQQLRILGQLDPSECPDAHLILDGNATTPELAAIMSYNNTALSEVNARRLVVSRTDSRNHTIPITSRLWEPLAYPLLFPHGTLGWGLPNSNLELGATTEGGQSANNDPETTQIWFYRARLLREERFSIFGRLTNEYVVDMFSRNLEARLHYIRTNQQRIRQQDAEQMGLDAVNDTENIYLPASFLGSNRWASEQIADSLAIAALHGPPTFFITVTCNRTWPEITSQLRPGQEYHDNPMVVCRVFRRKLAHLQHTLRSSLFPDVGPLLYMILSTEFQKRGLPHAHILLKYPLDCTSPTSIDTIISAEVPTDASDAALVRRYMMHHHPPLTEPPSTYCQRVMPDGTRKCRFGYPKPLQQQTTFDTGGRAQYRRRNPGDEMVVPYCLPLLRKYQCHMNFESANSSQLFQYLFKYIHKGPDHAKFRIFTNTARQQLEPVDEIQDYWDARYLSATEATWRILGYHITSKEPGVSSLPVHLPSRSLSHRQYQQRGSVSELSLSLLERYFRRPEGTFMSPNQLTKNFANITYAEYYSTFRLATYDPLKTGQPRIFEERDTGDNVTRMHVIQRVREHAHVARIQPARVSEGERYFLRALLQHRSANSFEDLRTINGVLHDSFQDAAHASGLFADDNEGELSIIEAISALRTPRQLRILFVHLLQNECLPNPRAVWDAHSVDFSNDHIIKHDGMHTLGISSALDELAHLFDEYGKTLGEYGLPEPAHYSPEVEHELAQWQADRPLMLRHVQEALLRFNADQRAIFDLVVDAVHRHLPLRLFIDGKAATATSAYAAQLYPGGRTTHSTFKVPVNEQNEMLLSPIEYNSSRGQLLREAAVIIWDEAPMANRAVLACVNDTLQRITHCTEPFGNKIIILLGDFRQTCPVIRRGSRAQIIDASIRSSPLWPLFSVSRLNSPIRNASDPEFAAFIDEIGDGSGPEVPIPGHMLQSVTDINSLIDFVFPPDILHQPQHCARRSILAPTNAQVDMYNDIIINRIPGPQRTYLAADSLREVTDAGLESPHSILDYAARDTPPGLPPHSLTIKSKILESS